MHTASQTRSVARGVVASKCITKSQVAAKPAAFVAPRHLSSTKQIANASILSTRKTSLAARASATGPVAVRSEISYIMIKPDGVQRGLVGQIITRFERKGFKLRGLKLFQCTKDIAEEHYKDLSSKPFFKDLVNYILSGPVVAMVWEGDGVVKSARKIIGATNPLEAEPGTIRGDFAVMVGRNVVHGSDSPENGVRETQLWFGGDAELVSWDSALADWLVEERG